MIATILVVDDDHDFEGLAATSPLPVLLTPIPAMVDYVNHLARMIALAVGLLVRFLLRDRYGSTRCRRRYSLATMFRLGPEKVLGFFALPLGNARRG
jgi:hypothetical protein